MPNTTGYNRGDVVLVEFVFSDESGAKLRPAVVVSSDRFHRARRELVIAAITSNVNRRLFGDQLIAGWREAGLLFPSMATGILRTVTAAMIRRRLGSLPTRDQAGVDEKLRLSLSL